MSRPRTPTAVLELRGAFKRNPNRGRDRADEPRPTTKLGDAPDCFTDHAKEIWTDMAAEGFWLTGADRYLFEVAVRVMAAHRVRFLPTPLMLSTRFRYQADRRS